MTAKLLDEKIATLNNILFKTEETHHTSGDSVVVLRNLTKSKTSIDSIQDFFQPHKLKYVRIFEDPEVADELLDLNLRKFHISGPATGKENVAQTPVHRATVSVLVEFERTEDLEPYFEKLSQAPNPFGALKVTVEHMNSPKVEKKESPSFLNSPPKVLYDSIVVENINEFFGDTQLTMSDLDDFLSKFKLFGDIDAVYFPTKCNDYNKPLEFKSVGFIGFAHQPNLNESILKCLYFLHDLDLQTFRQFSKSDITEISSNPGEEPSQDSVSSGLQLSICQKKHEPFLFNNSTAIRLANNTLEFFETSNHKGALADEHTFRRFSKNINFQQSNIYVNNLPIVFQNDDSAWFDFWIQFGTKDSIKSAKIIKPQFYSRRQNSPFGKFGFVFYTDLKPALKAILLTNNRLVSGFADYPKFHIEASFAIQKSTSERLQTVYSAPPPRQESYMPFPYAPLQLPLQPPQNLLQPPLQPPQNLLQPPLQSSLQPPPQPPLQHSPQHPLQHSPMSYSMSIYDGYGYFGPSGTGPKVRSKSAQGNSNESATPEPVHSPQLMAPYDNYYNYYMAMPYQVQANFAPNCGPAFAPAPFHNDLYTYGSQYGSQYGYYPFPYPGDPNLPNSPRRTSE